MCPRLSPCVCVFLLFLIVCPCIFKFSAESGAQGDRLGFGMISSRKYATGTKARSAAVITSVPSLDIQHPSPAAPFHALRASSSRPFTASHEKRPWTELFCVYVTLFNGMHGNVSRSGGVKAPVYSSVSHFLNQKIDNLNIKALWDFETGTTLIVIVLVTDNKPWLPWPLPTANKRLFSLPLRGKFAVVRKCVEKSTGKEFAAKYMRKRRKGQDCRTEIIHEIAVLELAAACPRVVNLHEVYEMASEMVLVLE